MAAVAQPHRPQIRRNSPLSISNGLHGFSADAPMLKRIDIDDSSDSDDEPPPAIKFSKVTQALLDDAPVPSSPPKQEQRIEFSRSNRSLNSSRAGLDTPSRAPGIKIIRKPSPVSANDASRGNTPPRIVHVGNNSSNSAAKRSISISGPYPHRVLAKREPTPSKDAKSEIITPAPAPRALRVRTRANSATSQDGKGMSSSRPGSRNGARSAVDSENDHRTGELAKSTTLHHGTETIARLGASTLGRSHNISGDAAPPPGSIRVKRAPITGTYLKSGPVRRFRRRESDDNDNVSPNDEVQSGSASASQPQSAETSNYTPQQRSTSRGPVLRSRSDSANARAGSAEPVSTHDFANRNAVVRELRPSSRLGSSQHTRTHASNDSGQSSRDLERRRSRTGSPDGALHRTQGGAQQKETQAAPIVAERKVEEQAQLNPPQRATSLRGSQYRYVPSARKIHTDAEDDQENMPPPTFKRNRDQELKHLGKPSIAVLSDDEKPKSRHVDETPVPVQQEQRKVLGTISGNTPHRTAPAPPPKMSVIDTATTLAGASVTKSRKKRSHIVVNGKIYTSMGRIGKGGSAEVLQVMAESSKTFALKRVKLVGCDESAVRGYKGEIDLLKKLTEVERVVRLWDWELNEEKQELNVLMERGDTDFNRLLTIRLSGDAKFDPVFTRYHWREMLECVQAVHQEDIVHSDLKPANFLLVQGRLKLIDFGIANAIETDHTVNVHRDTHVGTPNYMSPESITDTNAPQSGSARGPGEVKKDMKIGKASDVWSLGCILYYMTYGATPFAHISNQLSKIMAITNPNHAISFPETGVGGASIPPNLRGCLRRCLDRDPEKRPTVDEMLKDDDPYMYPERQGTVILDENLLGQIIAKVVERCRDGKRGIPSDSEIKAYPKSFMERVWDMQEKA